jgi:hypothetical protein
LLGTDVISPSAEGSDEASGRNRRVVAIAFVLRFWLHTGLGLDITIHDRYRVVFLRAIVFWCLMGTASAWLLFFLGYSFATIPDSRRGKQMAHSTDLGEEQ